MTFIVMIRNQRNQYFQPLSSRNKVSANDVLLHATAKQAKSPYKVPVRAIVGTFAGLTFDISLPKPRLTSKMVRATQITRQI